MYSTLRRRLGVALTLLAGALVLPGQTAATAQPIVGGHDTSVSDHPFAVFLVDGGGKQYCGGALLSETTVVTAAHCALAVHKDDLNVIGGREHTSSEEGVRSGVRSIWVASGYVSPLGGDDLAVLTLDERMSFGTAELATDPSLYKPGTQATVLGWGRTSENGPKPGHLLAASVPVVADAKCAGIYRSFNAEEMVCAGYDEGGIDACQGDSGGPLVVGNTVIGVVSWGDGCAEPNRPGVYTRVAAYADKIPRSGTQGG